MSLPKRTLGKSHVARDGTNLGLYDGDQIQDLLETGQLLPADQYYDEKSSTWIPLSELNFEAPTQSPPTTPGAATRTAAASPTTPAGTTSTRSSGRSSSGSRRSGRGSKSRKKDGPALGGWIACLFALGAAAGLWAWNQNLSAGLDFAEKKVREQTAIIDQLRSQIELLSELTPPGRIRAIITYTPSPDNTAIVSGATVELYRRAAMDAAIEKANIGVPTSEADLFAAIKRVQAALPPPLEVAVTKSNGRVEIPVPEPGAYVLLTTTAKATGQELIRFLWLIGFQSRDQPSKIILMNESNAISRFNPHLVVTEVQSDMTQPSEPGAMAPTTPPASEKTAGATEETVRPIFSL